MISAGATAVHRCRACAAEVRDGALRCPACGAFQIDLPPCPHCGGRAGVSPHPELRFVCDLCGGPRVPILDPAIAPSGRDTPALQKAEAARKSRAAWRAAAIASGGLMAVTVLLFLLLALFFGLKFAIAGLLLGAPLGALAGLSLSRASARGDAIAPAIDAAWLAAANDVAEQVPAPLSADVLAKKLGIAEPQAEELLALVDVNAAVGLAPARRARIAAPADAPAEPARIAAADPDLAFMQAAEEEVDALLDSNRSQKKL